MSETNSSAPPARGLTGGDGLALLLNIAFGTGEENVMTAPRRLSAAPDHATCHPPAAPRCEASGPRRAVRTLFRRRATARIEAAALDIGEYLCPPISTISIIASVCERLTMWAASDRWHQLGSAADDRRGACDTAAVEKSTRRPVIGESLPSQQMIL